MQRALRLKLITDTVARGRHLSVDALAQLTGVSAVTIRRDLAQLAEEGAIARVHGGAKTANPTGQPMPYTDRMIEHEAEKDRMARATASLIADHESVVMDNGTTCVAVARHVCGRPLTALALSLPVAAALADKVGASEVWAGFDHRPGVDASASDKSREFVESFNAAVLCGCSKAIEIKTPLQGNDKVDTLRTGIELHVDWRDSWSCYNAFAFPCGVCGSCVVRAAAFAEAGLPPEQTMSKEFIDAQLER